MKLSRSTLAILGLFAAFLLCAGSYFLADSRPSGSWRVETERDMASTSREAEEEGDGYPKSLLPGEQININTASARELTRLPGIGEVKAQAIVDYRAENGPFQSVEELTGVPGIGEGILNQLREYATVGET